MGFGASALVFDREQGAVFVNFNHIADAAQAMRIGPHRESAHDADAGARFSESGVGFFVKRVALCGGEILCPDALDMDERALPRAIEVVLERGERDDCAWAKDLKFVI